MTESIADMAAKRAGIRQKTINDNVYSIKLLPAEVGMEIGQRLLKGLGPAIGHVVDEGNMESLFPEENRFFTDLAILLTSRLGDMEIVATSKLLLNNASCNSQLINFNEHFAGNYGELVAVLEFALKENFGDFFTIYLKAKGLDLHTLKEKMINRAEKKEQSED